MATLRKILGTTADADTLDGMAPDATNNINTIVQRDGSGNFAAGTITAALTGNCSGSSGTCTGLAGSATILATARAINGIDFNGSIAIAIPSLTWTVVAAASQAAAVNNGYVTNFATLCTVTLPATAAVGSVVRIAGWGAGGWLLAQNANQYVKFEGLTTTVGVGGSLASVVDMDAVEVVCVVANNGWVVTSAVGDLTVV